jgi:predicted Holliday junction resolvase-like endonuclease
LKDEENRVILAQQRINRQQRVENQLLTLKKKFTKKYKKIRTEMLEKTKITTKEFIGEKLNKLAMETKFKRFKAEFYAPPTPGILK